MHTARQNRLLVCTVLFFLCSFFVFGGSAVANETFATVASPVRISEGARDHDIISYNVAENAYRASRAFADESMFGVIVDDPVLYMDSQEANGEGVRPVVRYGEVVVNVSDIGGEIQAGDVITTSVIPGVGQKTEMKDAPYILGFALDVMTPNGNMLEYEGKEVSLGTVPITLRIGPFLTREGVAFVSSGKEFETYIKEVTESGALVSGVMSNTETQGAVGAFKVFRYMLAAMVAVTSLVVSITRFGDTFKQGVVSIGRNPLARSQIRSIMVWDVFLIIVVTGAGLGIAAAIILFP